MKKCPYCAEEIQEAAVICRFCGKRVKANIRRIVISVIIMLSLLFYYQFNRERISANLNGAVATVKEFCIGCAEVVRGMRNLPSTAKSLDEHNKITGELLDKAEN